MHLEKDFYLRILSHISHTLSRLSIVSGAHCKGPEVVGGAAVEPVPVAAGEIEDPGI